MSPEAILDRRLYIWHDLEDASATNAKFIGDRQRWAHAVNQLLVYDQVVIPTNDFGIVPVLAKWYGTGALSEAIDCGAIRFLRRDSLLAYLGSGNGISAVQMRPTPQRQFTWWQEAMWGDIDRALDLQLERGPHPIDPEERDGLRTRVLRATDQFKTDNSVFMARVENETNEDIINSDALSTRVRELSGIPAVSFDLRRAPGMTDKVRFSGEDLMPDPVDLILRVAEINLDLLDAERSGAADICAADGAELVIASKAKRLGRGRALEDGLLRVLQLSGLPDIGQAVAGGQIPFEEVWKLRQHRDAAAFRGWVRKADPADARDLERAYVKSLESVSSGSLPVRAIRFVLCVGLDSLTGVPVASAVDAFLGDRLLRGRPPKLFIDRARRLMPAPAEPV
jgi:hypothetical protein